MWLVCDESQCLLTGEWTWLVFERQFVLCHYICSEDFPFSLSVCNLTHQWNSRKTGGAPVFKCLQLVCKLRTSTCACMHLCPFKGLVHFKMKMHLFYSPLCHYKHRNRVKSFFLFILGRPMGFHVVLDPIVFDYKDSGLQQRSFLGSFKAYMWCCCRSHSLFSSITLMFCSGHEANYNKQPVYLNKSLSVRSFLTHSHQCSHKQLLVSL